MSAKNLPRRAANAVMSANQWRAAKKVAIGSDFVLVRVAETGKLAAPKTRPAEKATALVGKAALALKTPGIARDAVFRGPSPQKVFAYSALPGDASKLVRETQDGTRQVGKIGADGKFRASRKAA